MPRAEAVRSEVQRLLRAAPFRPFALTMENADRITIEHPEGIAFDPATPEGTPFEPFRTYLTDGTAYEIRHPELVMVGRGKVLVGTPAIGQPGIFERYDAVSLLHVVRLVPLQPPTQTPSPTEGAS